LTGKQKDVNTCFVSDRNVGWGLVLVSIVATETSTVTFLSRPDLALDED
jgi:solute:Na+ symporter, SSS family